MIRLANFNDIDALIKLRIELQKEDYKRTFKGEDILRKNTYNYLTLNLNRHYYVIVYEENKKVVAMAGLKINYNLPQWNENGIHGYLCSVYTKPEFRGRGIQTRIIEKCLNLANEKHVSKIILITTNQVAINLYKKFGFKFNNNLMELKSNNL